MIDQKEIEKIIQDSLKTVGDSVKQQVEKTLKNTLKWNIEQIVENTTRNFLAKEILPELTLIIAGKKDAILTDIIDSLPQISMTIIEGLQTSIKEKMADKYNRNRIFKELFD